MSQLFVPIAPPGQSQDQLPPGARTRHAARQQPNPAGLHSHPAFGAAWRSPNGTPAISCEANHGWLRYLSSADKPHGKRGRSCDQPLEKTEEHTSELQSLMRKTVARFYLKTKNK